MLEILSEVLVQINAPGSMRDAVAPNDPNPEVKRTRRISIELPHWWKIPLFCMWPGAPACP